LSFTILAFGNKLIHPTTLIIWLLQVAEVEVVMAVAVLVLVATEPQQLG
jgi:hypothetical protein